MTDEQWVKIAEASKQCKVPRTKIYKLIDEGKVREKGNGVKKVSLPDLINALQGENAPLTAGIPAQPEDKEATEQNKKIARMQRDLLEEALEHKISSLSELDKTLTDAEKQRQEADRLLSQARQAKKDSEAECEEMVNRANSAVKEAQTKLELINIEWQNIKQRVEAKYQEADKVINQNRAEAQQKITESLQQSENDRREAQQHNQVATVRESQLSDVVSRCQNMSNWLDTQDRYRKEIADILGKILYALEKLHGYRAKMSMNSESLTPLLGQYGKIMAKLRITSVVVDHKEFMSYEHIQKSGNESYTIDYDKGVTYNGMPRRG